MEQKSSPGLVLSVSQLNRYLGALFAGDRVLRLVDVTGELSGFKVVGSGHAYFTLHDEEGAISCVMFRSDLSGLSFVPKNGMHVVVRGSVSLYAREGRLQLYAKQMTAAGAGKLYEEFLRLRAELEALGWFAPERKRPLPALPRAVGVVTSPSGAVLHDIQQVAFRRFPGARLVLAPARVQGEGAAKELAEALGKLGQSGRVDVIILARGGGSMEDLWPFNERVVAEAIVRCPVPVVSAVGHEVDFTIADFAADLRAPTPSAAAELVFPERAAMLEGLALLRRRMKRAQQARCAAREAGLTRRREQLRAHDPARRLESDRAALLAAKGRLARAGKEAFMNRQRALKLAAARLEGVGPLSALRRGFAMVTSAEGRAVTSAKSLRAGARVTLEFHDGRVAAEVLGPGAQEE